MYKKKTGSSLLLVLLVIASVITITIGAQRVVIVEFAQTGHSTDNVYAYYAAKAGIEDGLLRYRYDRNAETVDSSNGQDQIYYNNLTSGSGSDTYTGLDSSLPLAAATDEAYTLQMSYKTQSININNSSANAAKNPNFTSSSLIKKDNSITLTGFQTTGKPYYLRYAIKLVDPNNSSAPCSNSNAFVQLQVNYANGTNGNSAPLDIDTTKGQLITDSQNDNLNLLINSSGNAVSSIQIRPYYCDAEYAFVTTIHNNGYGYTDDIGPKFDSLTTTLTSTGYYGSAKRTLVATIDRTTGTLIGVYDYAAYAGTGNIN